MRRFLALAALALAPVSLVAVSSVESAQAPTSHAIAVFAPRGVGSDCARVFPLKRAVRGPRVLFGAMQGLLAGPTKAERARGYGGWFSARTAGHLRSARIFYRVAYIDFGNFAPHIPNASTSCGSTMLLAQLDRTAKQFPTVKRAVYSFNGSRSAFYEWLQRDTPPART